MSKEKSHWDAVYGSKAPEKRSWTQDRPSPSIDWIVESLPDLNSGVIDVGGGASPLVDFLLDAGFVKPAVLDISSVSLEQAKARLGFRASQVDWIEADITSFTPSRTFAFWHDRAVFHFLTRAEDRARYVTTMKRALPKGGRAIIATFSPTGPAQCSGLDVMRFDATLLTTELGAGFNLLRELRVDHATPWGAKQAFIYCMFELQST